MTNETFTVFAAIVGGEFVLTDAEDCRRAGGSWSPEETKRRGASPIQAVVRPADTGEVSAVLRAADGGRIPVYVVGGGSNTTGRGADAPPGIGLDLARLDHVSWDEESLLVTAGAGVSLASVEEQLGRHGYTLGHLPRSVKLATIGGAAATNAIGLLSGRYGRQSDLTAALEAVLPNGEILVTSPAPGANASFDLHSLFLGAEGQFGVITSVTLRMRPAPEVRAWAAFSFGSLSDAIDAARLVMRSDSRPAVLRVFDDEAGFGFRVSGFGEENGRAALTGGISAAFPNPESRLPNPVLLLGFEGEELAQTGPYQLAYAVCERVGGTPLPSEIGDEWFERREETGAWAANGRPGGIADVFAFGANWASLKRVTAAVRVALEPLVTHLSLEIAHATTDGAALEWSWEAQAEPPTPDESLALYRRIADAAYAVCHAEGGIIAHHFGVGAIRREAFARERGPAALFVLRSLKSSLDPNGILNP